MFCSQRWWMILNNFLHVVFNDLFLFGKFCVVLYHGSMCMHVIVVMFMPCMHVEARGQLSWVSSHPPYFWDTIYFCRGAAYSVLVGSWSYGQFCLSPTLIHTNAGARGVSHSIWHFPWVLVIEFRSSRSHSQHFNLLSHILDSPFRCLIVFIVVWHRVSFSCSGSLELIN